MTRDASVSIPARFRGPETSGNGGYTCGLVARFIEHDAEVTLRSPPPLGRPLTVIREPGSARLLDGETLVAEGHSVPDLSLDVPEPPTLAEAEQAAAHYAGFRVHAFPSCFVCGTDREEGDGLRLFPGPVDNRAIVAAPWFAAPSLPNDDGTLSPEMVWSALDCPGAWALERHMQESPVVLGRMAAHLEGDLAVGRRYLAMGWELGTEGRKLYSGTALFDEEGERLGIARQTWIVLQG
jgi:hypothetical protein